MARFNDVFLEREEDAVIRLRSLEHEAGSFAAAYLKEVYRCAGGRAPIASSGHKDCCCMLERAPPAAPGHDCRLRFGPPASRHAGASFVSSVKRVKMRASICASRRQFVDCHGEVLLHVHWSVLAYTGVVKILKEHHKRTGLLVRAPRLDDLAAQPFCCTEVGAATPPAASLRAALLCPMLAGR